MNETNGKIVARLEGVFREVFEDGAIKISEATTADDIEGWDSLKHVMLVLAVEKEFNVRLKASEIGSLSNVGEMVTLLAARSA